jgi:hypothetical protein
MVIRQVLKRIVNNQRGANALELLIAASVIGIIAAALTPVIFQVVTGNVRESGSSST